MLLHSRNNNYFSTVILKNLFFPFRDKMDVLHEGIDKYILNYPNSSRIFGGYQVQSPYILIYTPYMEGLDQSFAKGMKIFYIGSGRFRIKQVNYMILTELEKIVNSRSEKIL